MSKPLNELLRQDILIWLIDSGMT